MAEQGFPQAILVTCENGHSFRAKAKYAGRKGVCPVCHSAVEVPANDATLRDPAGESTGLENSPSPDRSLSAKNDSNSQPRQLGRFSILATLGEGGFGTVYQAHDPQLDRIVAIKVPRLGAFLSEKDRERFLREARAAAQLRHPNIVPIFDAGQLEGSYYIASAFIPPGRTLRDRIRSEGKFDQHTATQLIERIAMALDYAHAQGVIHRDIKPDNILLDGAGVPHVADFGLARREKGDVLMTQDGTRMGTPAYMSPELHRGRSHEVDGRSDLWALGVMLYEMLTGERPFQGGDHVQLMHAVLKSDPMPPRKLDPTISRDLETICLKCLAKEPENRYASCELLADDLMRWRREEPIRARQVSSFERVWRWSKRNPTTAGLISAVVLLTVVAFAGVSSMWVVASRNRDRAELNLAEAMKQRELATTQRQQAEEQKRVAETNLAEAVRQRQRAEKGEEELKVANAGLELQRKNAADALRLAQEREKEAEKQKQLAADRLANMNAAQAVAATAKTEATHERDRATQARRVSYVTEYANKLRAANTAIERRDFMTASNRLDECKPKIGEPDVRDFAWEHLTRQATSARNRRATAHVTYRFPTNTPNELVQLGQATDMQFFKIPREFAILGQPDSTGLRAIFMGEAPDHNSLQLTFAFWNVEANGKETDPIRSHVAPSPLLSIPTTPDIALSREISGQWQVRAFFHGRPLPFIAVNESSLAFFDSLSANIFTLTCKEIGEVEINKWNLASKKSIAEWKLTGEIAKAFDKKPANGRLRFPTSAHPWPIRLIPRPQGLDLLAIHDGNRLHLLDALTGSVLKALDTTGQFVGNSIDGGVFPSGDRIVLADSSSLFVQDLTTSTKTVRLACDSKADNIRQCQISHHEASIYLIDGAGKPVGRVKTPRNNMRVFDADIGVEKFWFDDENVERFAFSPDGMMMALCFPEEKGPRILIRYGDPNLRGIPIRVSYLVADSPPFDNAVAETSDAYGGTAWAADGETVQDRDIHFVEEQGKILLGEGSHLHQIADLGDGELAEFATVDPATVKMQRHIRLPAKNGHVYLLECRGARKEHWVLMKITF